MKKLVIAFVIISIFSLILVPIIRANEDVGGIVSIQSVIDYKGSTTEKDLTVTSSYISGWYGNNDGYFYAHSEDTMRIFVDEVYVKFNMINDNIEWKLGKMVLPFGFDYLDEPQNSVFISCPTKDVYDFGLHASYEYGKIVTLNGSYLGNGSYATRLDFVPTKSKKFKDEFGVSVTNHSSIHDLYGNYAFTNTARLKYTLFATSLRSEYSPDSGDFWSRIVITPGVFDFIGLFGAYYNVNEMEVSISDKYLTGDIWAYGAYIDISPNASMSMEWMNSLVLNPMTMRITVEF